MVHIIMFYIGFRVYQDIKEKRYVRQHKQTARYEIVSDKDETSITFNLQYFCVDNIALYSIRVLGVTVGRVAAKGIR